MSTDERHVLDPRPAVGDVLEHPLVGLERRRTAVAVAYLAILLGIFAVRYAGMTLAIDGAPLETTLTSRFDVVSAVMIALAAGTITFVPFLYAAWNGGPALSFAMPLVPTVLGTLATGRYVLTLDGTIALTVGGAASALALFATGVRRTGSLRPWRTRVDTAALLFVTASTVVAAAGVGRFVAAAPPRHLEGYAPFVVLWLVPLVVVGAHWAAAIRNTVAMRTERERSES